MVIRRINHYIVPNFCHTYSASKQIIKRPYELSYMIYIVNESQMEFVTIPQCRALFESRDLSNEAWSVLLVSLVSKFPSPSFVSLVSEFLEKLESWMKSSFECCGVKIRWISVKQWSCKIKKVVVFLQERREKSTKGLLGRILNHQRSERWKH